MCENGAYFLKAPYSSKIDILSKKDLISLGRPTDIGLQLGKACYPCSG